MKKCVCSVLLVSVLLLLCACSQTTSVADGMTTKDGNDQFSSDVQKADTEAAPNDAEADRQAIIDFVDATTTLKRNIEKHTYTSLSKECESYLSSIKGFESAASNTNSEYSQYMKSIVNNPIYDGLKELCADKERLDDPIQQIADELIIADFAAMILDTELPFEYESSAQKAVVNDEAKIDACRNTVFAAIDHGVSMYNYNGIEAILPDPISLQCSNGSKNGTLDFNCWILYSLPNFEFNIDFQEPMNGLLFGQMKDFSVSNGEVSVNFNSTRFGFQFGEGYHSIHFYCGDYDKTYNEKYDEIKDFINNNEHISFIVNNEWTMQVPDETVKMLREWFVVFDSMRLIVEMNSVG